MTLKQGLLLSEREIAEAKEVLLNVQILRPLSSLKLIKVKFIHCSYDSSRMNLVLAAKKLFIVDVILNINITCFLKVVLGILQSSRLTYYGLV